MPNKLKITLLQTDPIWHRPTENIRKIEQQLSETEKTDLILLPEMFSTGFTMQPAAVAEPMDGPTHEWMQRLAGKYDCAVSGSLVVEVEGTYRNRLLFVHPDGRTEHYDKRYLFTPAGESDAYERGDDRLIVEYRGWRICPLVCYDLRFPEWSRNREDYDLLLYLASWPSKRRLHWQTLLTARAIENQCYSIGVNRVGTDENGYDYAGDTMAVDPLGQRLAHWEGEEVVMEVELSLELVRDTRRRLPFLVDMLPE